jgi:hypothetical protein
MAVSGGASGCSIKASLHWRDLLPAIPERTLDLRPGQIGVVTADLSRLGATFGRRVELLPYVTAKRGTCEVTVEVFQQFTGSTAARMSPGSANVPVMGVALGQILRFGVIQGFDPQPDPPAPCVAVLAFTDTRGNLVGPTKAVNLARGQSDFLDLNPGLLLPASEILPYRTMVTPKLLLPASGDPNSLRGCRVSAQVFYQVTGQTTDVAAGN